MLAQDTDGGNEYGGNEYVGLYGMFEDLRFGKPFTKEWLRHEAQLN